MQLENVDVIQIQWDGPMSVEQAKSHFNDRRDCGIYQIYGTHLVAGPDTLLYIGRANSNTFGDRLSGHDHWFGWEAYPPKIFLGRICGIDPNTTDDDWGKLITNAERMLIWACAPAYNSAGLKTLRLTPEQHAGVAMEDRPSASFEQIRELSDVLLVNRGHRARLPIYCSTFLALLNFKWVAGHAG